LQLLRTINSMILLASQDFVVLAEILTCDVVLCEQMYFHVSNSATILFSGWQTSTPWRK